MACLGSRSCGRGELEPCYQGCSAWTNWIQECNWWAGTWEQELQLWPQSSSTQEKGDLGYVDDVLPMTCRSTKRLKSTGQYESGSCNCWWSDAQLVTGFLHNLKEGPKCWLSCNVFSERLWLYHVSWGSEKPLLTKSACALWREEKKNSREPKRSLAATVCICNCQQASTTWKSVLRRFSCSWGCARWRHLHGHWIQFLIITGHSPSLS